MRGGWADIMYVNASFSDEQIIHAAIHRRDLNAIVANYLQKKYNLNREDMGYYRVEKVRGHEIWPY